MGPLVLASEEVKVTVPHIEIQATKDKVIKMHTEVYEECVLQDNLLIYTDSSKTKEGTGVAYVHLSGEWRLTSGDIKLCLTEG